MTVENQLVYSRDDLAKVIGKVNRTVKSDLMLLQDSLIPLNKGKGHITTDHVERVIDSLNELLQQINKV